MIENIKNNPVAQMMGMNAAPQANLTNRPAAGDSDATLQVNYANMVNQALQTTETDAQAVSKAKELIQSGCLTTPENIRSAAENIVKFGI